ncbi:MAG: pilus assembly protein [Actinomycetia bacterium]|nr:pilus assembly protein [Actinomycetes bacterium]
MTPVFLALIFGAFEYGFAFRNYLTVTSATRDSARTATTFGSDEYTDYEILQRVADNGVALPAANIERIVVWHATGPDDTVPSGCVASGQAGLCNVYEASDLTLAEDQFGCRTDRDLDRYWCPSDREDSASAANGGPPDFVGIQIVFEYEFLTGLFGDKITINEGTVMRIEPGAF